MIDFVCTYNSTFFTTQQVKKIILITRILPGLFEYICQEVFTYKTWYLHFDLTGQ